MDRASTEPVPPEVRPFLDAFAELLAKQALEQTKKEGRPTPDDEPL